MALLDSFSGMSLSGVNSSSLLDMAKTAGLTKLGALGGATSTTGQSPATATKSYYKVVIQAQTDNAGVINITADCPAEFAFDTAVDYDSPYQNFIEDSVMAASPDKLKGLASNAMKAAHVGGMKMFTQALTAKVWNGAGSTTLSLPLIFQVESDPDSEVMMPLMQLMYLSMPKEASAGGFLSSPGPSFGLIDQSTGKSVDTTAAATGGNSTASPVAQGVAPTISSITDVGSSLLGGLSTAFSSLVSTGQAIADKGLTATVMDKGSAAGKAMSDFIKNHVKNSISIKIGEGFYLDNVVIKSVNQTQKMAPIGLGPGVSSGINSMVKVDVVFETFYTLTQRDILSMLTPMNNGFAPKTKALYTQLIGK